MSSAMHRVRKASALPAQVVTLPVVHTNATCALLPLPVSLQNPVLSPAGKSKADVAATRASAVMDDGPPTPRDEGSVTSVRFISAAHVSTR